MNGYVKAVEAYTGTRPKVMADNLAVVITKEDKDGVEWTQEGNTIDQVKGTVAPNCGLSKEKQNVNPDCLVAVNQTE